MYFLESKLEKVAVSGGFSLRWPPARAADGAEGGDAIATHDPPSRRALALGQPTRHRIFRFVAEASRPVAVAEITAEVGLHHTAVRQHLAKLCEVELLSREVGPRPALGRPAFLYRAGPAATPSPPPGGGDQQLSPLLVELLTTASTPAAVGAAAGRRLAATCPPGGDPVERLRDAVALAGFEPRVVDGAGGGPGELVFQRCAFEPAATMAPALVCELHRHVAQGVLDGLDAGIDVTALVVKDAGCGGCRLHLSRR